MEFIKYRSQNSHATPAMPAMQLFRKQMHIMLQNYFSFGKRCTNIIHKKVRHSCALNYDLYKRYIINNPFCLCGKTYFLPHKHNGLFIIFVSFLFFL